MKIRFLLPLLFTVLTSGAQTVINKTVQVQPGQKIDMHFDYPKLIRVTTWDKNEISIQGTVSINNGENDDAFVLETSPTSSIINIRNEIKGMKELPQRITIHDGPQTITFKDKKEFEKYKQEQGRNFDRMSNGVEMEIQLEIKIPKNVETNIVSVYGMVEIKEFTGPLTVEATYGGIDAALTEKATGEIKAETNFGEILTNLEVKFTGDSKSQENFHTVVSAKPGIGSHYSFGSKYGNVYLRKAN